MIVGLPLVLVGITQGANTEMLNVSENHSKCLFRLLPLDFIDGLQNFHFACGRII